MPSFLEFFVPAATYSPPEGVPSVLQGLTAEFGMGSGVTPASSHRNKKLKNEYEVESKKLKVTTYVGGLFTFTFFLFTY